MTSFYFNWYRKVYQVIKKKIIGSIHNYNYSNVKGEIKMFTISDIITTVAMVMGAISLFLFGFGKPQPKWFTYIEVPIVIIALVLGLFIDDTIL